MAKTTKKNATEKKLAKARVKGGKNKKTKGKRSKHSDLNALRGSTTSNFIILSLPNNFGDVDLTLRDDLVANEVTPFVEAFNFDPTPFGAGANATNIPGPFGNPGVKAILLKKNAAGKFVPTGDEADMEPVDPTNPVDFFADLPSVGPGTYKALAQTLWQVTLADPSDQETYP